MIESLLNLILSALLTTLSMPGYLYGGLVFFALVPLLFALEKKRVFYSSLLSFIYFFVFSFSNFHYIIGTLVKGLPELFGRFSSLTGFFVYILFCILEALPFLLFGLLYGLWKERIRFRILEPIFVASIFVISEYLRGLGDLGFTGGRLSDALYSFKGILQILPFTGTLGLVFVIVVVNYESYKLLKKSKYNISIVLAIFTLLAILNGTIENRLPIENADKTIILAQTNVPQNVKYSWPSKTIARYLIDNFSNTPNYLTIFPEAVFPSEDIRRSNEVENMITQAFNKRTILIGYPTIDGNSFFNSLVVYENGKYKDKYDKIKLFPFVEMLPYKSIFGNLDFLKGMYYFTPGNLKTIKIDNYGNVGLLICFESYFPQLVRKISENAEFIVVSTNDGWYDSKIALLQHYVQTVFRAVETRRYIVQVSNTGLSGVTDYFGNYVLLPSGTIWKVGYVKSHTKATFYTKFGDYIVLVALLLTILTGVTAKKKTSIFG
ncbi:MAG: apolipoprotein N-acyltransferase [Fervidobacterium sp.]